MLQHTETAHIGTNVSLPEASQQKQYQQDTAHSASYLIRPIDPTQLTTMHVYLSDGEEYTLLVPKRFPLWIWNHPEFHDAYERNYETEEEGTNEEWGTVPLFPTALSERWHRVAIQQAAGIAQSWRTNREQAYQDSFDELEKYREQEAEGGLDKGVQEPKWQEWAVPTLQQVCIQANANVVRLEPSKDSSFDYWLKISTLELRKTLLIPVKLADYHRQTLQDKTINSSMQLNQRNGDWCLTLSYDDIITIQTEQNRPVVGINVGVANFLTTSDGKQYGTFNGTLRERHKRDREKRRRKAKLRACLKKKGVENLPSTSSRSGQRLIRHVRQEINRAVNKCFTEHSDAQYAYEQLSIATMKHKARAMNAYMHASNLAHIPRQIAWNATKRGIPAATAKSAYSSQECHICHYVDRANRPNQQTFCCLVCGHKMHADLNAASNIRYRLGDEELYACRGRQAIKALLMQRHEAWKAQNGWS